MFQRGIRTSKSEAFALKKEVTTIDSKKVACYIYNECRSKNNQGGFASLYLKNKNVRQYQNDEDAERCHAKVLDRYFKVLPAEAMKNDAFYVQPLP